MAREVARLVPIHEAAAPFHQLPQEGSVTIGRRTTCTVVLSDGAVSGLHCILRCWETEPLTFQVDDKSTNGIFINEVRVVKGDCAKLVHGDVLSLGKAVDDHGAAIVRPQFRLEVLQQDRSLELLGQPSIASRELRSEIVSMEGSVALGGLTAPTSVENQPAKPCMVSSGTSTAEGFAQDLLVQEQRSKAKITGELLSVRRRLDDERAVREALDRDLRKARASLEDERARRTSAQEVLERLQSETEQFRQEHRMLQDLRQEHAALETKHETVEVELGALLQCTTTLEAGQEHLRMDWIRASSDEARVRTQLAEAQARMQQAQERIESSQKKHSDARHSVEVAQECVERWQRELSNERGKREQLEDQNTLLCADVDRASHCELAAKEALATVEAQQIELQMKLVKCREEAAAARTQAKEARVKLENDHQQAEHVRGAGGRFVEALRAYGDGWARGLADGGPIPSCVLGEHSMVPDKAASSCVSRQGEASNAPTSVKVAEASEVLSNVAAGAEAAAPMEDVVGATNDELKVPMACDAPTETKDAGKSSIPLPNHPTPLPTPAVVAGMDESGRPPVPLWQNPRGEAQLCNSAIAAGVVRGQQHGMASLMVGSQDSSSLPPSRSPEKIFEPEIGFQASDVARLLKVDAADAKASSVQRLASASILTLITPPVKRSAQPASLGRKRLRAR